MCGYWIMPQRNCQLLKRLRARKLTSLCRRIIEPVTSRLIPRQVTCVVFQNVVQVCVVERERLVRRIRISVHVAERERMDAGEVGGVETHAFLVAIGNEEVVAGPAVGEGRKLRWIKMQSHFIA